MKLGEKSEESSIGGTGEEGARSYCHLNVSYACMKFSNKRFMYVNK